MAFQVQHAAYADLDTLAEVMVSAHVKDEVVIGTMGNVSHETKVKWYADAFRRVWEEDKWVHYYKVVDPGTNKIVAMARFHYPRKPTARGIESEDNPYGPLPEGSNIDFCKEFFQKLEDCERSHLDKNKAYFVHFLATLPEYHRRGLGKMLIDTCLKQADEARAETFLIATPTGSGLYMKLGFEEIDRVSWDLKQYGGQGIITWLCMMRHPINKVNGR